MSDLGVETRDGVKLWVVAMCDVLTSVYLTDMSRKTYAKEYYE